MQYNSIVYIRCTYACSEYVIYDNIWHLHVSLPPDPAMTAAAGGAAIHSAFEL
jgi:hypothetical protein